MLLNVEFEPPSPVTARPGRAAFITNASRKDVGLPPVAIFDADRSPVDRSSIWMVTTILLE